MRYVSLVRTARSPRQHVTASSVQAHLWYHDDYVATLCGQWLQVGETRALVNIDNLDDVDGSLCNACQGRWSHVG